MRRLLVLALLASASLSNPSLATETAGFQQYLRTTLELQARDGTRFTLDVYASAIGAGVATSSKLVLDLRRCGGRGGCVSIAKARTALPSGAVSISPDLTRGSLKTVVAGLPLEVTLTHSYVDSQGVNGMGVDLYALEATSGGPSPRAALYVMAEGTATWGKPRCVAAGRLGSVQGIDRTGDDVRDPRPGSFVLPKTLRAALRTARC